MTDTPEIIAPEAPPRPALAYHHTPGTGPMVLFLCGYASDMQGTKALHLEQWARASGRAYLRFDYAGCGASEGDFEAETLASWRDDAIRMIDEVARGPVVLVGSSMGGWIMAMIAKARPEMVAGMVGIAAALIVLVGLYTGWLGWDGLRHAAAAQAAQSGTSVG